jgi:hypothetical protein
MLVMRHTHTKPRSPLSALALESVALIFCVGLAFAAWIEYSIWYEDTIPIAPVPEGARLLRRNPELVANQYPYHSSIARYWYYAKYSTPLSYEDVKAFYQGKDAAWPFGTFWVDILPPVTTPVTNTYDKSKSELLALPFERDKDDPPNETLILLEVSKTPGDYSLGLLVICLFPIALIVGFVIVIARYQKAVRQPNLGKRDRSV